MVMKDDVYYYSGWKEVLNPEEIELTYMNKAVQELWQVLVKALSISLRLQKHFHSQVDDQMWPSDTFKYEVCYLFSKFTRVEILLCILRTLERIAAAEAKTMDTKRRREVGHSHRLHLMMSGF